MNPPGKGGKKVYNIFGPGYMTKMAAMPIYMVKTLKHLLLQNHQANCLEIWHVSFGELVLKILNNDEPELTMTCFMARSN